MRSQMITCRYSKFYHNVALSHSYAVGDHLCLAASRDDDFMVEKLLKHKISVTSKNYQGHTPTKIVKIEKII